MRKEREVLTIKKHIKKMIVPIIVTLLVTLYCVLYFTLLFSTMEGPIRYVLGIIPIALAAVMVSVLVERIKEIKKGEEDDISKY